MNEPFDPSEWEIIGPELTDEEFAERARSNKRRYTTAQVIAILEALPLPPGPDMNGKQA